MFVLSVVALPFVFEHIAHVVSFANPTFVFQFIFLFLVKHYPVHICFSSSTKSHSPCFAWILEIRHQHSFFSSILRDLPLLNYVSPQLVDLAQSIVFAFGCFLTDVAEEKLQPLFCNNMSISFSSETSPWWINFIALFLFVFFNK